MPASSSAESLFHQAVSHHRAGHLAEAERLYRAALAIDPSWPEVIVNLGIAQLGQQQPHAAIETLRRALALNPDLAGAHFQLGSALAQLERYDAATEAFSAATRLAPAHAESHNNLGNARLFAGDGEGAIAAYRRAIALKPGFALALNNLGYALLQAGKAGEAVTGLEQAVAIAPNYPEARNNLGRAYSALKRHKDAVATLLIAVRLAPQHADAHANLAAALYDVGDLAGSEREARAAVGLDPGNPAAHNALGNAVRHQGRVAEAESHYREALRIAPDYVEGYKHLALALQEQRRYDEAFALFDRHAAMTRDAPRALGPIDPAPKARHDADRAAWIAANPATIEPGARVAGPAVDPANCVADYQEIWNTSQPQVVVIDNLLTPPALDSLRQFCLRTDAWREAFERGYLGAVPESGFTPPIVAQIAEELRAVYPAIIGEHPLMYFWGFKYDSALAGIRVHADFAAVNVNFWITADAANRDPDHGGLVIYDVAAPLDWTFERYNAADAEIRALIAEKNAPSITVPYRENRAAIFDSDLFHETDTIDFGPGYDERRINVTLLFGRREDAAGQRDNPDPAS